MGSLSTNTDALTSGKFRLKVLEDMFSGKAAFLAFEYTHREGNGIGKVPLDSSPKDWALIRTLSSELNCLSQACLGTLVHRELKFQHANFGVHKHPAYSREK